jgi:hypothetical protein
MAPIAWSSISPRERTRRWFMPGWYIHMETAKQMVDRLRAGDVPPDFPGGPEAVQAVRELGEVAHTWRNYLAVGALGPDLFFLLPDFKGDMGNALLHFVDWTREVWEDIDETIVERWETWVQPILDNDDDFIDGLSGGSLHQIGQALEELTAAIRNAFLDLLARLWDWFGLLTSGVPSGYSETAFFWSDMFHYRKTSTFAKWLLENAQSPQHIAFALGWLSHCATDTTGHSFVNAKCGGPYRLHWQRHHLIENHMDALVYHTQHGGVEPYGELDSSALHFRIAFRQGLVAPYVGADDAPAYDYFGALPPYSSDVDSGSNHYREDLWDLDSADLPDELCDFLIRGMQEVFGEERAPRILTDDDPEFRDGDSGRPSTRALQNMFATVYHYLKFTTTRGYSPPRPQPPQLFNPDSVPRPPGSDSGVGDDPTRGGDPDEDDDWSIWDLFLAVFAFLNYIRQLAEWLATWPLRRLADLITYPVREFMYETVIVPLWSLYMVTRRPLVMMGFIAPKSEEISPGLVELGISSTASLQNLSDALNSPDGTAPPNGRFTDPSGRWFPGGAYGADRAYPRAIIEDEPTVVQRIVRYLVGDEVFCGRPRAPSEFLRPWAYPERNNAGETNGWEPHLTHPGPWRQGQTAADLMNRDPGNTLARQQFEGAADPGSTEAAADAHLPFGRHLGDPVDYGVYLVGRLASGQEVVDFNLDSDRGYGYQTWDWDRDPDAAWTPCITGNRANDTEKYATLQPCTVPEGFCQNCRNSGGPPEYDPSFALAIHYGEAEPSCDNVAPVTPDEERRAGMTPTGTPVYSPIG